MPGSEGSPWTELNRGLTPAPEGEHGHKNAGPEAWRRRCKKTLGRTSIIPQGFDGPGRRALPAMNRWVILYDPSGIKR